MLYLWEFPKICPNKLIAVCDNADPFERFILLRGKKLSKEEVKIKFFFHLGITKAEIAEYDCIPNNANVPLVNQRIIDILLKLSPNAVEYVNAEIQCKDGILSNYKLLNIVQTIRGVDHEKSIYTTIKSSPDVISRFKYLIYIPGSMGSNNLAREEEYLGILLATEEIKHAFEQAKIKGVRFVKPEDYYRPLGQMI